MARWTDLADWRGPTPNQGGAMVEHRGVVLHIAEGYYEGTISWQRNPSSNVSSHFIIGRARGEAAQMVDTDTTAWTQRAGNGRWLSIEMVGFTKGHRLNPGGWERLTSWQIERAADILARAHQTYGHPLRLAESASGKGLGYHSMGGSTWGHQACPGPDIIAQRADILTRAKQITEGGDMPTSKEIVDELLSRQLNKVDPNSGTSPTMTVAGFLRWIHKHAVDTKVMTRDVATLAAGLAAHAEGQDVPAAVRAELTRHREMLLAELGDDLADRVAERLTEVPAEQVRAAVRAELDRTRLAVDEG